MPEKEAIPKTIQGVKTDVIQRKYVLHDFKARMLLSDLTIKADETRYNELRGGMSLGPCRSVYLTPPDVPVAGNYVFTGTLGAIVTDNGTGEKLMLSNFHVMCVDDQWKAGDTLAQPSLVDKGQCPADVVGKLLPRLVGRAGGRCGGVNHDAHAGVRDSGDWRRDGDGGGGDEHGGAQAGSDDGVDLRHGDGHGLEREDPLWGRSGGGDPDQPDRHRGGPGAQCAVWQQWWTRVRWW